MNVTIFGGSAPKAGDVAYEEAYRLGFLLGSKGHTILTGGYMGTMEAASRGASEAGAHVIGVTCEEVEVWRPRKPNPWIKEERRCLTLRDRLWGLIEGCDAAAALPGGVGTLAEISLLWNLLIIGSIPQKPLILVGEGWEKTFSRMFDLQGSYLSQKDRGWLSFAADIHQAAGMLAVMSPEKGKGGYN